MALLGQLKAQSPARAVPAQVISSTPTANGQFQVTLELQGQRFTLSAALPPVASPISIYRQSGVLRVASAAGGLSRAATPINSAQQWLSALPQIPSPAASIAQSASALPSFAAWAGVFAQITQPEALKRWVEANQRGELLQSMASQLPESLRDRFVQANEQRQVQAAEDQRQGQLSFRFDVPLPLGERWVNGEATLKRSAAQRDQWSFELIFDLPTAGRLVARAKLTAQHTHLELQASQKTTQQRLVQWAPNVELRLRAAGLQIDGIQVTPWQAPARSQPHGRLDIRV